MLKILDSCFDKVTRDTDQRGERRGLKSEQSVEITEEGEEEPVGLVLG